MKRHWNYAHHSILFIYAGWWSSINASRSYYLENCYNSCSDLPLQWPMFTFGQEQSCSFKNLRIKAIWMRIKCLCTKTGPLNYISYHLTMGSKYTYNPTSLVYVPEPIRVQFDGILHLMFVMTLSEYIC